MEFGGRQCKLWINSHEPPGTGLQIREGIDNN